MLSKQDIESIIHQVLDDRKGIEAETHSEHHRWVNEQIERQRYNNEMRREIAKAVAQWSVVGLIGWLAAHFGINMEGAK